MIAVNQPVTPPKAAKWPLIVFSALVLLAFFLPWVSWDAVKVSGADMPLGNFFAISETQFKLSNPFPQYNFAITALWLIPVLAAISALFALLNKKATFFSTLAGLLALCAATAYILFSNVLGDLGVKHDLQIGIYITIVAGAGIILAGTQKLSAKIVLLIIGPALTWAGFYAASDYLENEKFADTANTTSDYTVNAVDLIREFHTNDSAANAKYREKIITVNGNISEIELPNDSTVNIKFIDTTGSYAIFPFHGEEVKDVKTLKKGHTVSVKGSCSGGVLSEILGIESITFKRTTLNKK
jgi:hypothetical protein